MSPSDKNSHEKEAENEAKQEEERTDKQDALWRKTKPMTAFLSILFLAFVGILGSIAIASWQKGGYTNAWIAFAWGVAAYVLLGAGVFFAYYHNVIKPAKAARERRALPSERPELFVERAIAQPLIAGKPKVVVLQVRNRGKKTARNITVGMNQAFSKADFGGPLKYEFLEPDTRPDCAPDAIVTLISKSSSVVALWEIKALNDGKAFWFHFGKGTYEDASGNIYDDFDFCYMYEPSTAADMRICPDRYWPKKADSMSLDFGPRPELFLEGAEGRCEVGKPPQITFRITNWGQLTAHKIELETSHYFPHARTFKGPFEYDPNTSPYALPALPANGGQAEGRTEGGPPFSSQDVADIEGGKLLWLNYSKGKYEDGAGNRYPFDFCVLYKPGRPLMDIAPKAYWPKDS